jgi:hypothetical protein
VIQKDFVYKIVYIVVVITIPYVSYLLLHHRFWRSILRLNGVEDRAHQQMTLHTQRNAIREHRYQGVNPNGRDSKKNRYMISLQQLLVRFPSTWSISLSLYYAQTMLIGKLLTPLIWICLTDFRQFGKGLIPVHYRLQWVHSHHGYFKAKSRFANVRMADVRANAIAVLASLPKLSPASSLKRQSAIYKSHSKSRSSSTLSSQHTKYDGRDEDSKRHRSRHLYIPERLYRSDSRSSIGSWMSSDTLTSLPPHHGHYDRRDGRWDSSIRCHRLYSWYLGW